MSDLNRVVVTGRLTRDAEKKTTASGLAVVRFSLANGYRKKDGDQWVDETSYFDCVFIGNRAERAVENLKKGRLVVIDGELRQSRWEQNGEKKSKVEILVNNIQMPGSQDKPAQSKPAANPGPAGPESFEDDNSDIPF